MRKLKGFTGLVVLSACLVSATSAGADVVSDWNAQILLYSNIGNAALVPPIPVGRPGPPGLLDIALAHVAIHDAVQAIEGEFQPYSLLGLEQVGRRIVCRGGRRSCPEDAGLALLRAAVAAGRFLHRLSDQQWHRPTQSGNRRRRGSSGSDLREALPSDQHPVHAVLWKSRHRSVAFCTANGGSDPDRHPALHPESGIAVPARAASPDDQHQICAGVRRGQSTRQRCLTSQCDHRSRALLVGELHHAVERGDAANCQRERTDDR